MDDIGKTAEQRIAEIDQVLFDAGVAVLRANTKKAREDADNLIMDARVKLEKLRRRLAKRPAIAF